MNARTCIVLLWATGMGLPAFGESHWSDVPASASATALDTVYVPDAPTEAVVTLVGAVATGKAPSAAPLRVFGTDLVIPVDAAVDGREAQKSALLPAPEGARWPDGSGRIAVEPVARDLLAEVRLRNPWEMRVRPRPAVSENQFLCGGIVAGGPGGPIGIMNGHVVKRGDSL